LYFFTLTLAYIYSYYIKRLQVSKTKGEIYGNN
jgi:hypothetical protein